MLRAKSILGFFKSSNVLLLLVGVLAICALLLLFGRLERQDDEANQKIGSVEKQAEINETVLTRTLEGNDAKTAIDTEAAAGRGAGLYAECLRSNTGSIDNCQRFLPEQSDNSDQR